MKKLKRTLLLIAVPFLLVGSFFLGITLDYYVEPELQKEDGPASHKYYITKGGKIRTYDMGPNHQMLLYFDNSINEEDEIKLREGAEELDEILIHDSIKILKERPKHNNYIEVSEVEFIKDNVVGTFYNSKKPKRIELKKSLANFTWYSDKVSQLKKVFQHELGHALGLADLYDVELEEESIMYYLDTGAHKYTQLDIENIQRIY